MENFTPSDPWDKVISLWLEQDYSPLEIAQELSLPVDKVMSMTILIDQVHKATEQRILAKIKRAIDYDD